MFLGSESKFSNTLSKMFLKSIDYFMENFEPDLLQKKFESLTAKNMMIISVEKN